MKDKALFAAPEADGTFTVGIAERDTPGWVAHSKGWATLEAAQAEAAAGNADLGLTVDEAADIRASSMRAGAIE